MKDKQVKYPQLRFKGFTDPWEERKLGDYIIQYSEKTKQNNQYPVFTSSRNGLFFQKDYYKGNQIASEDNTGYNIVPRGYFTYRHMSDDLIFKFNINDLADYGIVSTLYPVFTTNEQLDSKYLQYQLNEGSEFRRFSLLQKQGGSRTYMYLNKLQNMILTIPKLEEQQKIGSFFKQLDNTIALHQRKLDLLKEQKKGYLQKMFPKNGEKVPELRFAGFADDWEERKFEDLLDSKDGVRRGPFGSALKKEFFVENSEYVVYEQQNAIYDNYHTRYKITKEKFDELSKFKLNPGDFIMSGAGTIGRISRVPDGVKLGVFNQALIRFRINPEITDSEYFIQFVRADFMQKNLTGANPGSAITNLVPMSEVKKWEIKAPHLEEQEKIGSFFKQLDDTIALHQRKLDLLKEQKKGYLQKMFV